MKQIKIGGQIWSAGNLSIDTFQIGDLVPQTLDEVDWINAGINKEPFCWSTTQVSEDSVWACNLSNEIGEFGTAIEDVKRYVLSVRFIKRLEN